MLNKLSYGGIRMCLIDVMIRCRHYMKKSYDQRLFCRILREPDTLATGHFGTKTLRHHKIGAEVSGHFGTGTEVSIGVPLVSPKFPHVPLGV